MFRIPIEYLVQVPDKLGKVSLNLKDCIRDLTEVPRIVIGYTPKGLTLKEEGSKVPTECKKFSWDIFNLIGNANE
jgi:hypothetical protein